LKGPAANARTDRMVYVDCREDYRITGVIYINGMAMSRNIFSEIPKIGKGRKEILHGERATKNNAESDYTSFAHGALRKTLPNAILESNF